jgi:hypothetical protein
LSKSFIAKINASIRKFLWVGIQVENPSNPMAYRSWDDICKPKAQGGLGIRDMELINKSLIIHSAWNVATHKNPFLSNILKAKYYINSTFWIASTTRPRSIFFGLLSCRSSNIYMTTQFYRFMQGILLFGLHHGLTLGPPFMTTYFYLSLIYLCLPLSLICGCREHNRGMRNEDLLSTTFTPHIVQNIITTPVVHSSTQDILRWKPATNGNGTSKAIYTHL